RSRTTSGACCRLASTRLARCIREANFITSNRSRLLLHSAASWPIPTLIPAPRISGSRARPLPGLGWEAGGGACGVREAGRRVVRALGAALPDQGGLGPGGPPPMRGDAVPAEDPRVV